jgi:hypothetical protein
MSGLYKAVAISLYPGPHAPISLAEVLKTMGLKRNLKDGSRSSLGVISALGEKSLRPFRKSVAETAPAMDAACEGDALATVCVDTSAATTGASRCRVELEGHADVAATAQAQAPASAPMSSHGPAMGSPRADQDGVIDISKQGPAALSPLTSPRRHATGSNSLPPLQR